MILFFDSITFLLLISLKATSPATAIITRMVTILFILFLIYTGKLLVHTAIVKEHLNELLNWDDEL